MNILDPVVGEPLSLTSGLNGNSAAHSAEIARRLPQFQMEAIRYSTRSFKEATAFQWCCHFEQVHPTTGSENVASLV